MPGFDEHLKEHDLLETVKLNDGTKMSVIKGVVTEFSIRQEGNIHNVIVHLRFEESALTKENIES